jgi:hypothetical protein
MDQDNIIAISVGCIMVFCGGVIMRVAWIVTFEDSSGNYVADIADTV